VIAAQPFSFASLAAVLVLAGLSLLLSWRQYLDIEKGVGFACIRAYVQLMAIGGPCVLLLTRARGAFAFLSRRRARVTGPRGTGPGSTALRSRHSERRPSGARASVAANTRTVEELVQSGS
jgi:hypothetical protein